MSPDHQRGVGTAPAHGIDGDLLKPVERQRQVAVVVRPNFRQDEPRPGPVEQGNSQKILKVANLPADPALRESEILGRPREIHVAGGGLEGMQGRQGRQVSSHRVPVTKA